MCGSVFKGKFGQKHVSKHVRSLIEVESGTSDGVTLLILSLLMTRDGQSGLRVFSVEAARLLLSSLGGLAMGRLCRNAIQYANSRDWTDEPEMMTFSFALALLVCCLTQLLGGNELIAFFCTGIAFASDDWFLGQVASLEKTQQVLDTAFNVGFFLALGFLFPVAQVVLMGWTKCALLSIVLLAVRRPITLMILRPFLPVLKRSVRESIFVGWFGPMGVGSIYYAINFYQHGSPAQPMIIHIVFSAVLCSTIVHGITVPLFHLGMTMQPLLAQPNDIMESTWIETVETRTPHCPQGDDEFRV